MEYDFETLVERKPSNMKLRMADPAVLAAGNISFDGAEPDFRTAPVIEEAVIQLARNGLYGFTLCDEVYCEAVAWWMREQRGIAIGTDWIVPTLGTIYSVATAIRLLTAEGEGIIITPPVYNRYEQAATRLYRRTEKVPLLLGEGRYRMDFAGIEQAMQKPENRVFVLCNPHNPIGQVWTAEELAELSALANQYQVTVVSDEIFADNCYGGRRCPCYLDAPGARQNGIVLVSLGKAFHFTGVNHANAVIADGGLRERFEDRRTRDHYGSLDPLAYESVVAAYTPEGRDWLCAANAYVEENIRRIRAFFAAELPQVPVYGGEAGYILWMDWRECFHTEEEMVEFLYHKAFFHVDPGSSYGQERFARMCVAAPWRCIEKALGTLKEGMGQMG